MILKHFTMRSKAATKENQYAEYLKRPEKKIIYAEDIIVNNSLEVHLSKNADVTIESENGNCFPEIKVIKVDTKIISLTYARELFPNLENVVFMDNVKVENAAVDGMYTKTENFPYVFIQNEFGLLVYNTYLLDVDRSLDYIQLPNKIRMVVHAVDISKVKKIKLNVSQAEVLSAYSLFEGVFKTLIFNEPILKYKLSSVCRILSNRKISDFQIASKKSFFKSVDGVLYSDDGTLCKCPGGYPKDYLRVKTGTKRIYKKAFYGCFNLKRIDISNTVSNIDSEAFCECRALQDIKLGSGIDVIKHNTFNKCFRLKSIDIPSNVHIIEENAFYECSNLNKVKFNDGLEVIEDNAFIGCDIRKVSIPKTVKSIGASALFGVDEVKIAGKTIPEGLFASISNMSSEKNENRQSFVIVKFNGSYVCFPKNIYYVNQMFEDIVYLDESENQRLDKDYIFKRDYSLLCLTAETIQDIAFYMYKTDKNDIAFRFIKYSAKSMIVRFLKNGDNDNVMFLLRLKIVKDQVFLRKLLRYAQKHNLSLIQSHILNAMAPSVRDFEEVKRYIM